MDLKDYTISFLVVGLFIVCMFSFGALLQSNNKPISGMDNIDGIDITTLTTELEASQQRANDSITSFASENPVLATGEMIFVTVPKITLGAISNTVTIIGIIFNGLANVLGIPPLVLGILSAILLISMIFAAWKVIKAGK